MIKHSKKGTKVDAFERVKLEDTQPATDIFQQQQHWRHSILSASVRSSVFPFFVLD